MNYNDVVDVYNNMNVLLSDCDQSQLLYRLQNIVIFLTDHHAEIQANNPEYIIDFFDENERYYQLYTSVFDDSSKQAMDYTKYYMRLFELCVNVGDNQFVNHCSHISR